MKKIYFAMVCVLGSCGDPIFKEKIDEDNDPVQVPGFPGEFEYQLPKLPKKGQALGVWTGNWWPLSQGGVSLPLKKLDQVTNGQGLAYRWEMETARHRGRLPWAGHCNGLAAAGTMTKEPQNPVTYKGVSFSVEDIKGLLVEAWQGGGQITGLRCMERVPSHDPTGRPTSPECRDLNPGAFHLGITNFLGRQGLPVIIDITKGFEVWNYPVVGYRVMEQKNLTESQAAELLGLSDQKYPYNEEATRYVKIQTKIQLASGNLKIYDYILEGSSSGEIIGGEWIGASKNDHPDFMWRHTEPETENPHVDIPTVYEIYHLSLGGT